MKNNHENLQLGPYNTKYTLYNIEYLSITVKLILINAKHEIRKDNRKQKIDHCMGQQLTLRTYNSMQ